MTFTNSTVDTETQANNSYILSNKIQEIIEGNKLNLQEIEQSEDYINIEFNWLTLPIFPTDSGSIRKACLREVIDAYWLRYHRLFEEVKLSLEEDGYHSYSICRCNISYKECSEPVIYETTSGTIYVYDVQNVTVYIPISRKNGYHHSLLKGLRQFEISNYDRSILKDIKIKDWDLIQFNWDHHIYSSALVDLGKTI